MSDDQKTVASDGKDNSDVSDALENYNIQAATYGEYNPGHGINLPRDKEYGEITPENITVSYLEKEPETPYSNHEYENT